MAQIDEVKADVAGLRVDLEAVRQRADAHRGEFDQYRNQSQPALQDLIGFRQSILGFNAWAKVLTAIAGSAFLAVCTMCVYGLMTAGRVDQRVTDLDRRVSEVVKRLERVEERLGRIEAKADTAAATADQNAKATAEALKVIADSLQRLEAGPKKP